MPLKTLWQRDKWEQTLFKPWSWAEEWPFPSDEIAVLWPDVKACCSHVQDVPALHPCRWERLHSSFLLFSFYFFLAFWMPFLIIPIFIVFLLLLDACYCLLKNILYYHFYCHWCFLTNHPVFHVELKGHIYIYIQIRT